MLFKFGTVAVGTLVLGLGVAEARAVAQISGPRELPPASYSDQTYVDSKGCVFMRAGVGRNLTWVARVNSNRKPLCGYPPSLAVAAAAAPAPAVRLAPVAPLVPTAKAASVVPAKPAVRVAAAAPAQPAASATPPVVAARPGASTPVVRVAAAVAPAASSPASPTPVASVPGPNTAVCPALVPVAALYATAGGGRVVLCTRGDGTLNGARAPLYAVVAQGVGNRVGAGIYGPGAVVDGGIVIPAGYKLAWKDDRLNPNRGVGTAAGQAQQDRIWTRDVPAVLVAEPPIGRAQVVASSQSQPAGPAAQAQVRVSTKTEPNGRVAAQAAGPALYVQVGTFGVPANADGAKATLRGFGLPVGTAKVTKGGKALQVIVAGPYVDATAAQAALVVARRAGFKDAFVR
ncbi:MAG: SPOR domain-containing protein [Pseudorhodobacter sp.]|nr:SPOR domain-containing protein [Pseudorhodobacter sp.]